VRLAIAPDAALPRPVLHLFEHFAAVLAACGIGPDFLTAPRTRLFVVKVKLVAPKSSTLGGPIRRGKLGCC
jgi:hypothetical protein